MSDWSRRDFLKSAAAAGAAVAAPNFAHAARSLAGDSVTISILHTTDLHGHILPTSDYAGRGDVGGLARCVTQIRRWQRQNRNSILIDVGDVYQGTHVSLRNRGELMIQLLNHLKYDAWIVGNHEFDWGIDAFQAALERSNMPVLAANVTIEGKSSGDVSDSTNPLSKIQPSIMREFEGIKIAIVGVTTPGMPFWFRPEFIRGLDFPNPVEPVRSAINLAKAEGADVVVLAGHMGLKWRSGGDDFANSVVSLTSEFPEVPVFIAGHTHQLMAGRITNQALVTQADHFGIYVGRVDLTFDRSSKRIIGRDASCELMDARVRMDHLVLSRARSELEESAAALTEPIGELAETLHSRSREGEPSEMEWLIGAAIEEALKKREISIDGVFHGVFDEDAELPAGPITVNDIWSVIPYENFLVTAQLTPDELRAVMEESFSSRERRSLIGFEIVTEGRGFDRRIRTIRLSGGRPIERERRYSIAFNTFDSRSGGHRFMKLRDLLERPETACRYQAVQTRDALIEYFRTHGVVRMAATEPVRTPDPPAIYA